MNTEEEPEACRHCGRELGEHTVSNRMCLGLSANSYWSPLPADEVPDPCVLFMDDHMPADTECRAFTGAEYRTLNIILDAACPGGAEGDPITQSAARGFLIRCVGYTIMDREL